MAGIVRYIVLLCFLLCGAASFLFAQPAIPWQIQISCPVLTLALNNSRFSVEGKVELSGTVIIQPNGIFRFVPEGSRIEHLFIRVGKQSIQDVNFRGENDSFVFSVKKVKNDNQAWEDITASLFFVPEGIRIDALRCPSIGKTFLTTGAITLSDGQIVLALTSQDISIADVLKSLSQNENITLEGLYSGETKASLSDQGVALFALFHNTTPGKIMVQGDVSFLKGNLSQDYYRLVIENFKNYQYNRGEILAQSKGKDIVVKGIFDSDMGKREIEILLHGVL